ncbi:hypothetical protein Ancab_030933, partial [Ancistrocladus abbreviatus]
PMRRIVRMKRDESDDGDSFSNDSLLWSRDLEKHFLGDFSFTVVQASDILKDYSQ